MNDDGVVGRVVALRTVGTAVLVVFRNVDVEKETDDGDDENVTHQCHPQSWGIVRDIRQGDYLDVFRTTGTTRFQQTILGGGVGRIQYGGCEDG